MTVVIRKDINGRKPFPSLLKYVGEEIQVRRGWLLFHFSNWKRVVGHGPDAIPHRTLIFLWAQNTFSDFCCHAVARMFLVNLLENSIFGEFPLSCFLIGSELHICIPISIELPLIVHEEFNSRRL